MSFEIVVHYPADQATDLDDQIIAVVTAVDGVERYFSGCGFWKGATRNLGFVTDSFSSAVEAQKAAEGVYGVKTAFVREGSDAADAEEQG